MRLGLRVPTTLFALTALTTLLASCNFFDSTCDEETDPSCLGRDLTGKGIGVACLRTVQCDPYLICVDDTCQPAGETIEGGACKRTAECNDGLYCEHLKKSAANRVCATAGEGAAGDACLNTAECEPGLVCALGASFLSLECAQAGTLDKGEACNNTLDCQAGLTCLPTDKTCRSNPIGNDTEIPPIPFWAGVECPGEDSEAVAYLDVPRGGEPLEDFYRLPFPNDVRTNNGRLDITTHPRPGDEVGLPIVDRFLNGADGATAGFSTNPVVFFRFSRDYNFDDVNSSTAMILDMTPGLEDRERTGSLKWHSASSNYICDNWLSIRRPIGRPLKPGRTYAAIITTAITQAEGGSFGRSADLMALLNTTAPGDSDLRAAWDAYAPLRAYIEESNTPASSILNAAVFTTQDPTHLVARIHEDVQENAPAEVSGLAECGSGVTSPCEAADGSSRGACVNSAGDFTEIHGRISLPMYQVGQTPFMPGGGSCSSTDDCTGGALCDPNTGLCVGGDPELIDGQIEGDIALDNSGNPQIAGRQDVCFALAVPNGSAPAEGWPLLVYGHGTGGVFTSPIGNGWAAEVARGAAPAATIGFDLPQHGERRGDSTEDPDLLFFNVVNPHAARGNVLQGAADFMSLVRWARAGGVSASDSPTGSAIPFNPARIAIFGHSQGATHASIMLPFEEGAVAGVLSGVGGHLTTSLLTKTEPLPIADAVGALMLDLDGSSLAGRENNPALALVQTFYDSADPINYAHMLHVSPPDQAPTGHHVFMTYGRNDHYSPVETQQAYALAGELPHVERVIAGFGLDPEPTPAAANVTVGGVERTVGMKQYEPVPDSDGSPVDGHFVSVRKGQDGHPDVARFLLQVFEGRTPTIGD